ncbi:hypothetical protein I203_105437 [Kwoniella mangroviensis CBS 8507]|uniref:uncharacterized protein n=1 Tax=Kwoniella mangroviensis CBS 8507 TaxID=1296122 RepID=UPI00080D67F6|nr:uncharacterized protein I203_01250 [Kwoniella mangroviensis CBS 8507]OCF69393.1 hypothetical protein I203_01250 [Kwoniella mangroviensis CBS 8507]
MSVTSDMFSVGYITGEEWQTIQYRTHEEFDPHRRGTWTYFQVRGLEPAWALSEWHLPQEVAQQEATLSPNVIKALKGHRFWWKSLSRGENTFEELPAIDEYESDRFLLSYGGRSRRDPSNDHAILRFQELESFALSHGEGSNGLWYKAYKAIGKDMLGFTDDREEADSGTFTYLPLTYPHFYRSARPSESILPSEVGVSPATGVPVTWGADVIDNEQTEHTVYPVEGTRPPGWTGTEEDLDTQV